MGRPPGKINDTPFQMRASKQFLKSVDKWRARQPDKPRKVNSSRADGDDATLIDKIDL